MKYNSLSLLKGLVARYFLEPKCLKFNICTEERLRLAAC